MRLPIRACSLQGDPGRSRWSGWKGARRGGRGKEGGGEGEGGEKYSASWGRACGISTFSGWAPLGRCRIRVTTPITLYRIYVTELTWTVVLLLFVGLYIIVSRLALEKPNSIPAYLLHHGSTLPRRRNLLQVHRPYSLILSSVNTFPWLIPSLHSFPMSSLALNFPYSWPEDGQISRHTSFSSSSSSCQFGSPGTCNPASVFPYDVQGSSGFGEVPIDEEPNGATNLNACNGKPASRTPIQWVVCLKCSSNIKERGSHFLTRG